MPRSVYVKLDEKGIAEILTSPKTGAAVNALARQVAGKVRVPPGVPVTVESYTTDRAAAAVAITSPRGLGLEAKNGYLARAAAACGLEVRRR